MYSSINKRLSERSYKYNDGHDRSPSRRQYGRSRSSRSRSPDGHRSSADRRPPRNFINVCTSTSYFSEGNKFYISVGVHFETREYEKLNTACTFYTSNPPTIYMELIGCILIILILKKNNLEHKSLNIYSKIKTLEDCIYINIKPKYATETLLINFLKNLIDARPGSVHIRAGIKTAKEKSISFELAKSNAKKEQYITTDYLFLLPKEISDEPGGKDLYEALQKVDVDGKNRKMSINGNQYHQPYQVDSFNNESSSHTISPKLETEHSSQNTSKQSLSNSNQLSSSSGIHQSSSASPPPPPGWPSNIEYPLSSSHAIQLILTIISLTELPNHSSMTSSSMTSSMFSSPMTSSSISSPSSLPPNIVLSQPQIPGLSLNTTFSNMNNASSILQSFPNHMLSNLPQPSRSGLLYSSQHTQQFQNPQNNK